MGAIAVGKRKHDPDDDDDSAGAEAEDENKGDLPSTARSMMVGRFFPGADGRLPIRSRCGRVYD